MFFEWSVKMKKLKKLSVMLLPALIAACLAISCESEVSGPSYGPGQSAVPSDPLKVETEDLSYNWADWVQGDEIPYKEPEEGITIRKLQMITTGPGADCSREMSVSWHSPVPVNYVEYTMASDTGFASSRKIWIEAETTKADRFTGKAGDDGNTVFGWCNSSHQLDNTKFYVCKATLTGLKPDTEFIYRVGTNGSSPLVSAAYSFKTAGNCGGQYSFFWAGDLHTPKNGSDYINRVSELIKFSNSSLKKKNLPEIDFILFTGDLVNQGGRYSDWLNWDKIPEMKNYMWASCTGNHDYYWYNGYKAGDDKARVSCRWQLECTAFPETNKYTKNGTEVELPPSHYWYLYNRVLFIGIDSMYDEGLDEEYNTDFSRQKAWFLDAVEKNEGKYDYIVAFQHYAYIVNNKVMYGNYNNWRKVYDKAGVDFALSGDSHEYDRTYELFGDKKIEGGKNGTVYVTSAMTEGDSLTSFKNKGSGTRTEYYGDWGVGGCYFVVNSNSMTMYLIGKSGKIYDQKTVGRKPRN